MRLFAEFCPMRSRFSRGLRGAISIALAWSLRTGPARELIVSITYLVAVFSILVQGVNPRFISTQVGKRRDADDQQRLIYRELTSRHTA